MRKWTLLCGAVIVVGFMADAVSAQTPEPIQLPQTVIQSSQPMPVAQPSGLFGRMRSRRGMNAPINQPIVQAQAIETTGKVQQAQATEPAQMPAMQSAPMRTQMQVMPERRMGLLARLRDRRGF